MNVDYFVKTTHFEGPLDLLLHLIRVHEIDIFDIDVLRLTQEYLEYLRLLQFDDLKQAGDFLEMAATLIEIKTRMLLPVEDKGELRDGDEAEDDDPVRTLQERLIQYEMFRSAAEHFSQMPQMGVEIQTSSESVRLEQLYDHIEAPWRGDVATLIVLYEQMLRALSERKPARVTAQTHKVSVEETILKLEEQILTTRFALFQGYYNRFESRYEFVVHILAMLELVKSRRLKIYQQEMMGPIWMYRPDCDENELPLGGEADKRVDSGARGANHRVEQAY